MIKKLRLLRLAFGATICYFKGEHKFGYFNNECVRCETKDRRYR